MEERLNKWLSRMGVCSRREADRLISEGKVLVDGKTAQMGQRIEDGQKVICDGKPVGGADGGRGEVKPPRPVLHYFRQRPGRKYCRNAFLSGTYLPCWPSG